MSKRSIRKRRHRDRTIDDIYRHRYDSFRAKTRRGNKLPPIVHVYDAANIQLTVNGVTLRPAEGSTLEIVADVDSASRDAGGE